MSVHCGNHELPLFKDSDMQSFKSILSPFINLLSEMRSVSNLIYITEAVTKYSIEYNVRVRSIADKVEQRWLRHLLQASEVAVEMYPVYLNVFLGWIENQLR